MSDGSFCFLDQVAIGDLGKRNHYFIKLILAQPVMNREAVTTDSHGRESMDYRRRRQSRNATALPGRMAVSSYNNDGSPRVATHKSNARRTPDLRPGLSNTKVNHRTEGARPLPFNVYWAYSR